MSIKKLQWYVNKSIKNPHLTKAPEFIPKTNN